jgi:ABC-type transport system involved in multi-copper enzyme maturation permease subunit
MSATLRRIRLVAGHAAGTAVRMRLTQLLLALAALLVTGALALRDFNFGTAELQFIADFGWGAIGLAGTVLAVLVPAQLFFADVAGGAVAFVLTRPVRRWEYLAGQLGGVAALSAIFTTTLGMILAGLLLWRAGQLGTEAAELPALLTGCALQWMKSVLVAAMTLLVCTYAGTALFASAAGLLLAVIGHLRPFATGGISEWLRVWPNLALFTPEAPLAAAELSALTAYWALGVGVFVVLSSYVFSRREF